MCKPRTTFNITAVSYRSKVGLNREMILCLQKSEDDSSGV